MLPFFNIIEYPYGMTHQSPKESPVAVLSIVLERFIGKKDSKRAKVGACHFTLKMQCYSIWYKESNLW